MLLQTVTPNSFIWLLNSSSPPCSIRRLLMGDKEAGASPSLTSAADGRQAVGATPPSPGNGVITCLWTEGPDSCHLPSFLCIYKKAISIFLFLWQNCSLEDSPGPSPAERFFFVSAKYGLKALDLFNIIFAGFRNVLLFFLCIFFSSSQSCFSWHLVTISRGVPSLCPTQS